MNKDEALELALEALENGKRVRNAEGGTKYQPDLEDNAITAIKQARSAPVATNCRHCGGPNNLLCAGQCKTAATESEKKHD
jgi:hypothetical protein